MEIYLNLKYRRVDTDGRSLIGAGRRSLKLQVPRLRATYCLSEISSNYILVVYIFTCSIVYYTQIEMKVCGN